jgi:hypothetical protein
MRRKDQLAVARVRRGHLPEREIMTGIGCGRGALPERA